MRVGGQCLWGLGDTFYILNMSAAAVPLWRCSCGLPLLRSLLVRRRNDGCEHSCCLRRLEEGLQFLFGGWQRWGIG